MQDEETDGGCVYCVAQYFQGLLKCWEGGGECFSACYNSEQHYVATCMV